MAETLVAKRQLHHTGFRRQVGHWHVVITGWHPIDDEAVADPDPQHVGTQPAQKAVIEPRPEPESSSHSVEGEAWNQHGADLVVWNDRGISAGLGVAVGMRFPGCSAVMHRQHSPAGWGPGEGQAARRLIVEQRTDVCLARHGIEDHDPSAEIERVKEVPKGSAHAGVINRQRGPIGEGATPKISLRIGSSIGPRSIGHATEGSEQPRSATAGEVLTTTSDNRLGESTLTPATKARIG